MEMRTHSPWTVTLDLQSRLDVLAEVQATVEQLTDAVGLDDDAAADVAVAVRESVINAIRHGNHMQLDKHVRVSLVVFDESIEVEVADEGAGFDPDSLPDPVDAENLLRPDGRGILFMKSFMDEVAYSFPRDGGTVVRMRKRLGAL
jgi:serine/threonine-protein kinase RsbW